MPGCVIVWRNYLGIIMVLEAYQLWLLNMESKDMWWVVRQSPLKSATIVQGAHALCAPAENVG